jgi:hypothetical protein
MCLNFNKAVERGTANLPPTCPKTEHHVYPFLGLKMGEVQDFSIYFPSMKLIEVISKYILPYTDIYHNYIYYIF